MTQKDDVESADDSIDRALRLLGRAAPLEGMEERVLRRVAQHQPEKVRDARRPARWMLAGAVGVAGVALCVVGLRHRSASPVPPAAIARNQDVPRVVTQRPVEVAPAAAHDGVRLVHTKTPRTRTMGRASFPAPEAPLTKEERMLVALARRADPAVVEALDPVHVAAVRAQQDKQFMAFLESTYPGGSE